MKETHPGIKDISVTDVSTYKYQPMEISNLDSFNLGTVIPH